MIPFASLPETVRVAGEAVPIRTDFRVWVQFEQGLLHGADDWWLLRLVYPGSFPPDAQGLVDAAIWFYRCGDQNEQEEADSDPEPVRQGRFYDFAQDADTIFSSFWQAYGVDLSAGPLHWWNFSRLLRGLPEDSPFMRVIHYRTADLSELPKSQKKHYAKMRKLYALRDPDGGRHETLEERNNRMRSYVDRRFREMQRHEKN